MQLYTLPYTLKNAEYDIDDTIVNIRRADAEKRKAKAKERKAKAKARSDEKAAENAAKAATYAREFVKGITQTDETILTRTEPTEPKPEPAFLPKSSRRWTVSAMSPNARPETPADILRNAFNITRKDIAASARTPDQIKAKAAQAPTNAAEWFAYWSVEIYCRVIFKFAPRVHSIGEKEKGKEPKTEKAKARRQNSKESPNAEDLHDSAQRIIVGLFRFLARQGSEFQWKAETPFSVLFRQHRPEPAEFNNSGKRYDTMEHCAKKSAEFDEFADDETNVSRTLPRRMTALERFRMEMAQEPERKVYNDKQRSER